MAQGGCPHGGWRGTTPNGLWSGCKRSLLQRCFGAACTTPDQLQWSGPQLVFAAAGRHLDDWRLTGHVGGVCGRPLPCVPRVADFRPLQHHSLKGQCNLTSCEGLEDTFLFPVHRYSNTEPLVLDGFNFSWICSSQSAIASSTSTRILGTNYDWLFINRYSWMLAY